MKLEACDVLELSEVLWGTSCQVIAQGPHLLVTSQAAAAQVIAADVNDVLI